MSNIDKQWLQQKIADMEEHRDLFPGDLDDDHGTVLAAFRIALASIEAEPVAMRWRYLPDGIHGMGEWNYRDQGYIDTLNAYHLSRQKELLYTAPPAPVSVPDEMTMQKALSAIDQLSWQECTRDAYMLGWNACRAAMLQGGGG